MPDTLLEVLICDLRKRRPRVVVVDGLHGTGKTTLSLEIAKATGFACVHLDAFLEPGRSGFVEHLRWPQLRDAIRSRPIIVEGVCALTVLQRLECAHDYLVYVEDHAPETRRELDVGTFAREVLDYQACYRPHEMATFVYRRGSSRSKFLGMQEDNGLVDVAYINSRTKLAIVLALGGMMTLFMGLGVLAYGASGSQAAMITVVGMEVSASGMGSVIMATSCVWACFAYRARPQYSRKIERVQKFDEHARLTHMEERSSSTQTMARPTSQSK